MSYHQPVPDHVRRIIDREGELEFTPPSFERWLGRLQMVRIMAAMGGFMTVWLMTYTGGEGWEIATIRGIIAALAFHFVGWAVGLFIFGELYHGEVTTARRRLEAKERDRARRIEEYYRERLRSQGLIVDGADQAAAGGAVSSLGSSQGATTTRLPVQTSPIEQPAYQQRAAA